MSSGYDLYQQVFCLSLVIDTAWDKTGDVSSLETILTGNINTLLSNAEFNNGDSWSLVWGPVVWQAPGSQVVDQAMAVCYNSTQNFYVVPISATSPCSAYDIFFEDMASPANFMLPFPNGGPGMVSAGNSAALQVLLAMQSGGQTLSAFLGTPNPNDSVAFCGHSLGGGLTPLLAYALFPKGTSGSGWKNVYTYPTAGPATADQAFATAFSAVFPIVPGKGYRMWNANQYNSYDIVPNAWSGLPTAPGISQIAAGFDKDTKAMFYTDFSMGAEVAVLQTIATTLAEGTTGANTDAAVNCNQLFSGPRDNGKLTSNAMLESEIAYQHTVAYSQAFGVTSLFPDGVIRAMIQPPLLVLVPGVAGAGANATASNEELAPAG
jgi:hypothetical protein